jgi:F0F1-type ATP synthase assembly protein I
MPSACTGQKESVVTKDPLDARELGYYFSLAQGGVEMVVPLGIGLYLDYLFQWSPWGLIIGTVLGFVGGLFHLVAMVQRHDAKGRNAEAKKGPQEETKQ